MIRIVRLSHKYYGYDMGDISYMDMEDFYNTHVDSFVNSGDPVLLVNELDDIEYMIPGFDVSEVEMVGKNDEE